jgi:hypothetical protein
MAPVGNGVFAALQPITVTVSAMITVRIAMRFIVLSPVRGVVRWGTGLISKSVRKEDDALPQRNIFMAQFTTLLGDHSVS